MPPPKCTNKSTPFIHLSMKTKFDYLCASRGYINPQEAFAWASFGDLWPFLPPTMLMVGVVCLIDQMI